MWQGLCLGPVQKGRGSTWKGGPLECGVLEFGGRALSEGLWVGFRPSMLEGASECRGGALGGGVGAGLGLCAAGGRLQGQRIRPRSPAGSPVPKWTGKALAVFPSIPSTPSPTISPRASPVATGPLTMGGSRWVLELLPSPSHPSGVPVPEFRPLLLLPLPSLSLRTRMAGRGLGGQRIRPGISVGSWGPKWARETWPHYLLIISLPSGSPISPLGMGTSPVLPPLLLPLHSHHAPRPT